MASSGGPSSARERYRSDSHRRKSTEYPTLPKRLIIAVDFGTTYSSVSYVEVPEGCPPEHIDKRSIRSIKRYPDSNEQFANDPMLAEVPSLVIYPLNPHFRSQDALLPHRNDMKIEPNDDTEQESTKQESPEDFYSRRFEALNSLSCGEDAPMDMEMVDQFYWGYKVHERWALPVTHSDPTKFPLSRFKLLLDDSKNTAAIRQDLNGTLNTLKRKKVVDGPLHVIADYLTYLLDHVQSELLRLGYDDSFRREMVLCVPAIWKPKACRDMQTCLAVAMKRANFQGVDIENNSIENLFIVSEPEAAAEFIGSSEIMSGQSFVMVDAGGGTVDANTYRVTSEEPVRLQHEVVPPGGKTTHFNPFIPADIRTGGLHGSSYLNEDFKEWLMNKLKDEKYLEEGSQTINGIVEQIMIRDFESRIKRSFDVFNPAAKQISISGLRDNPEKGFRHGLVTVPAPVLGGIFLKRFRGIWDIIEEQLNGALRIRVQVEKVILIGGFGSSISLVNYLKVMLRDYSQRKNCRVTLVQPEARSSVPIVNAVSAGGVYRALNMENGPERIAQSSYGVLRDEPYEFLEDEDGLPKSRLEIPEHKGQQYVYDEHDGFPYVKNTILWVLKRGQTVPSDWHTEFESCHTIDYQPTGPLICVETLYVSDDATESHYRRSHPKNRGAERVGVIEVDFACLRDEGKIMPQEPPIRTDGVKFGKKHFKIDFTMKLRVVGRDLECRLLYVVRLTLVQIDEWEPRVNFCVKGNNGPDPVDLASNIGTWVAAGVAIIALVGVVGPLLALQASMSDKNRAMNAVQDQQQKYVSRGFPLTKGLRVFRRIRVPNLAPGYITNEPDTAPLIPPLSAALGRWGFKSRDYLPWNNGWAKMSELIESYQVRDGISNGPVDLGVPKTGGTLEVVNSRTALVVNKHWILILGLLGRYGERVDKGILQRKGVRRNFDGERASIRHFTLPRKAKRKDFETPFEWVRKEETRSTSRLRERGSPSRRSESVSSWSDRDSDTDGTVMAVRRSAYGTITIETTPQPTLYGVTGKMQQLGRHKGSWSYLTAMSFVPHIAKEIFEAGVEERREDASLQTLFWLAHGFLPCGRTADGRQSVVSLEAPEPHLDMMGRKVDHVLAWPAYSLQESDDIPIAIGVAMQCLGIPEPQILQFLPIDDVSRARRMLDALKLEEKEAKDDSYTELHSLEHDTHHDNFGKDPNSPSEIPGLSLDGAWIRYSEPSRDFFCLFRRQDLEKTLRIMLTLDWDNWGFLTWKDKLWMSILRDAIDILKLRDIYDSGFGRSSGLASYSRVFEWKHGRTFYTQKLADHLALDKFLTSYFETYGLLPLRLSLEREISELEQALKEVEEQYWIQMEIHQDDEIPFLPKSNDSGEIVTHMVMEFLDTGTMDCFHIHYEEDGSRYYRITGYIAPWQQEILWKHTSIRRKLHKTKRRLRSGVLEYTYNTRQLKWYSDKTSMLKYSTWQLSPQDVVITDGKESMWIEEKDMVMVALWIANRAAMWIGAQDSKPLLEFVESLDTYIYVLSNDQYEETMLGFNRIVQLLVALSCLLAICLAKNDEDYDPSTNYRPRNVTGLGDFYGWVGSYYNATAEVELNPVFGDVWNWTLSLGMPDEDNLCSELQNYTHTVKYDAILSILERGRWNAGSNSVIFWLTLMPQTSPPFNVSSLGADFMWRTSDHPTLEFPIFSVSPSPNGYWRPKNGTGPDLFNFTTTQTKSGAYSLSGTLEYEKMDHGPASSRLNITMPVCNTTELRGDYFVRVQEDAEWNTEGWDGFRYPNVSVQFDNKTANLTLNAVFASRPVVWPNATDGGAGYGSSTTIGQPGAHGFMQIRFSGALDAYHSDLLSLNDSEPVWLRTLHDNESVVKRECHVA
ncbi:hypothetical protein FBEOM_6945 [Fusarium beomiforme]|uniref:Uncharacterized protein n=1 Tax=Fusarium beomiforme TaxID=44412 RepID=A0A9P5AHZ7_9HYPO|nr:hypothetical protein FBEOM_6945 [Fusarium beomiforme]